MRTGDAAAAAVLRTSNLMKIRWACAHTNRDAAEAQAELTAQQLESAHGLQVERTPAHWDGTHWIVHHGAVCSEATGFGAYADSATRNVALSNVNFEGGYYGFYAGNGIAHTSVTHSSFKNMCTALHVGYTPTDVAFTFNSGTGVGTDSEFLDGLSGITFTNNNIVGPAPTCGAAPSPLLTYYALIGGSKRADSDVDALLGQLEAKFAPPPFRGAASGV